CGDGYEPRRLALEQRRQPRIDRLWLGSGAADERGHANHQQPAQIAIAHARDPTKPLLASLQFCSGVRPSEAANCRPERNRSGSITEAASAVAEITPTPGIVASRCDRSLERCQASSSFSSFASCTCRAAI